MPPRLPPELLPNIASNISKFEDTKTLGNAALVSSEFRWAFQAQLFAHVGIYRCLDQGQPDTTHHLAGIQIFHENAGLLLHLRAFSMKHTRIPSDLPAWVRDGWLGHPLEPRFVELIRLLITPSIQEIEFVGWTRYISDEFQASILAFMRSPQLKSVSLKSVSPKLFSLLESSGFTLEGITLNTISPQGHSIRNNAIDHAIFKPPSPLTKETPIAPLDFGNIYLFLRRCASSLHGLHIHISHISPTRSLSPDKLAALGQLSQLRKLGIEGDIYEGTDPSIIRTPSIPELFIEALPSPSLITEVTLTLTFFITTGPQTLQPIDQLFGNRTRFPDLQRLNFNVTLSPPLTRPVSMVYGDEEHRFWKETGMAGVTVATWLKTRY